MEGLKEWGRGGESLVAAYVLQRKMGDELSRSAAMERDN